MNNQLSHTYEEQIYNSNDKVESTTIHYKDSSIEFNKTTDYRYNQTGNLIKMVHTRIENGNSSVQKTIYSDYDNQNNPFFKFPLVDHRGVAESPNNFTSYQITNYYNGEIKSTEKGEHNYDYTSENYPEIGRYDCH